MALSLVALAAAAGVVVYIRVKRRAPDGTVTVENLGAAAGEVLEEIVITAQRIGERVSEALPLGIRNNNPGNIEWIEDPAHRWRGMIGRDGRYGVFDSMMNGVRAVGGELKASARKGQHTVAAIVTEWAPPPENDTAAYIADVAGELGVAADQPIDVDLRLADLAAAIIRHENGGLWSLSRAQVAQWVRL